jgi:hypothetical protein
MNELVHAETQRRGEGRTAFARSAYEIFHTKTRSHEEEGSFLVSWCLRASQNFEWRYRAGSHLCASAPLREKIQVFAS